MSSVKAMRFAVPRLLVYPFLLCPSLPVSWSVLSPRPDHASRGATDTDCAHTSLSIPNGISPVEVREKVIIERLLLSI